jgi:hypothetical protein
MTLHQQLLDYVNAAFTGLWIHTREPDEAAKEIRQLAAEQKWHLHEWDVARGDHTSGQWPKDPEAPLKALSTLAPPGTDATTLLVLHNFHLFLKNPVIVQQLFNSILEGKTTRAFLVLLAPVVQIPLELEKVFVVVEHQLPDQTTLAKIAVELEDEGGQVHEPKAITAAAGLTRYEAEGAFALSIARHGQLNPAEVWELKESMLKKSGLLQMHRGKERFDDLGGLAALKHFCRRALQPGRCVRPRGVLLFGVPGTGKSAFAKALGNETGRKVLSLDLGSMKGSLVGQSEERIRQALKVADAMAPCVLFVDEVEKALAGAASGYQGDGGVAADQFGTLLTWLNDHESDVFFICTSNDVSKLPPEFCRAERFDGIFFIDLPTAEERHAIWAMYHDRFTLDPEIRQYPTDTSWTGAEIRACCRLSALLGVSLDEAAKNVVPVAVTAADKVTALREWASGRCLNASVTGIYHHQATKPATNGRRAITRKENPCAN